MGLRPFAPLSDTKLMTSYSLRKFLLLQKQNKCKKFSLVYPIGDNSP